MPSIAEGDQMTAATSNETQRKIPGPQDHLEILQVYPRETESFPKFQTSAAIQKLPVELKGKWFILRYQWDFGILLAVRPFLSLPSLAKLLKNGGCRLPTAGTREPWPATSGPAHARSRRECSSNLPPLSSPTMPGFYSSGASPSSSLKSASTTPTCILTLRQTTSSFPSAPFPSDTDSSTDLAPKMKASQFGKQQTRAALQNGGANLTAKKIS